MAQEAFYFSHDYGSRNDPKLQKVLMKIGHEGKSVYWDLIEMMYEEGGYLRLSECENYAFALRTNEDCIAKLISDFGLFQKDDNLFWSDSILRRLEKRGEKSRKAAESARLRWGKADALKLDANASKNDAIKDSKGKDSKEEDIKDDTIVGEEPRPVVAEKSRVEKFVAAFNEIKKSKYTATKDVKTKFSVAIKTYTAPQIVSVIHAAIKDPKHIENNFIYVTPEYVLRPYILERYLNLNTMLTTKAPPGIRKIDHSQRD